MKRIPNVSDKELIQLLKYDIAQLQGIETDYRKEIYRLRDEVEKLQEYKEIEENKLLLTFPCKVGDIVYELDLPEYGIIVCKVIGFHYVFELTFYVNVIEGHGKGSSYEFSISEIGERVFLVKEDAENKLRELEEQDDNKI